MTLKERFVGGNPRDLIALFCLFCVIFIYFGGYCPKMTQKEGGKLMPITSKIGTARAYAGTAMPGQTTKNHKNGRTSGTARACLQHPKCPKQQKHAHDPCLGMARPCATSFPLYLKKKIFLIQSPQLLSSLKLFSKTSITKNLQTFTTPPNQTISNPNHLQTSFQT